MKTFTGQAGVGLLLTPTCPIRNLQDVTRRHVTSMDILSRYFLIPGNIESAITYIHVLYAPVQPGHRADFFGNLPRHFEEYSHHIVLGDFHTVISSRLDLARHGNRNRHQGRDELLDWMSSISLVDSWRLQSPHLQQLTSPNSSSRIDYTLDSSQLFHTIFGILTTISKAWQDLATILEFLFDLDIQSSDRQKGPHENAQFG